MAESSQPKQKKRKLTQHNPPAISFLADSLLAKILSVLPTKQSVSTSILSKEWETVWTSVPVLDFDDSLRLGKRKMSDRERQQMFTEFVYSVLLRLQSKKLKRFSLVCNLNYNAVDVSSWVRYALVHKVKEVELNIRLQRPPRLLFNCNTLSVMKVKLVSFELLASISVSLPKLKVLHLGRVTFSHHNDFVKLLLGCPILKELVMENMHLDCRCGFSVRFELDLGKLTRASIGFSYYGECIKVMFFQAVLRNVQSLFISWSVVPDLSLHSIPVSLMNLKQLEVSWETYDWAKLITILEYCPQLEQLVICKETFLGMQLEWKQIPDTPLEHLNSFCMKNYEGTGIELEIVGYVLKNAIMLKTLKINVVSSLRRQERLNIHRRITKLQKDNNENCQVIFDQ